MNGPVKAVVVRRFSTSATRVFDAWLDPAMLGRWMFGPNVRDEQIVRLAVEPRVGDSFSFVVNRAGTEIDHLGEYLEINRPHRLVFTWAIRENLPDTSRVIVEIIALADNECELTLTHEMSADWAAFVDQASDAWTRMLDVLAGVLG